MIGHRSVSYHKYPAGAHALRPCVFCTGWTGSRLTGELRAHIHLLLYYVDIRFLYKGIIIKHNKTEPTYTKTSLFLCEKRRFFMARTEKGVVTTI